MKALKVNAPVASVYRKAAQVVTETDDYSCTAIQDVCRKLGLSNLDSSLHLSQYQAMFSTAKKKRQKVVVRTQYGSMPEYRFGKSLEILNVKGDGKHPFWGVGHKFGQDEGWTEETAAAYNRKLQEYRATALCFMAAIVENP